MGLRRLKWAHPSSTMGPPTPDPLDRGMIDVNPIAGLKPPHRERPRELLARKRAGSLRLLEIAISAGKHPIAEIFPHGHKSATTNPEKIRVAVRQYRDTNLAIVPAGNLIILDVDGDLGRATFDGLNLRPPRP